MDEKLLLLGLLRGQQMHGYQLYEFIGQGLAICTDLKKPTAYSLLNKMAQDGWIDVRQEQDGNRPLRKVYRITEAGEAVFQRLLRENLATYVAPSFSGDIGLAFLDALPPDEAGDLLRQRCQGLKKQIEEVQSAPPHSGSLQLLIDHQRRFLSNELEWNEALLKRIEEKLQSQQE